MEGEPGSANLEPRGRNPADRAAELAEANERLREESERLRARSVELTEQLATLAASRAADRQLRLATLNLIEDLEAARRQSHRESVERRRAERSLRVSEELLRTVLEAVNIATWEWDPQSDRVTTSHTMQDLFGLRTPADFSTATQGLTLLHPEDRPRYRADVQSALARRSGWHTEYRIIRPSDRAIVWLEERAHFVETAPGAFHVSGVVWDITERKRAEFALREREEHLRLIVENAREYAIFSMDLDRRVTSWNTGAEQILGFSQDEMIGESGDIIFVPEDKAAGAPEREAEGALREGRAADERWHQRKDGSRFWGNGMMMRMEGAEGRTVGFVKILRDHTEAKRHDEALKTVMRDLEAAVVEAQHAREQAESANRTKDSFLAALSHELRTPLTPVLIAAESLLRRKDLPARVTDALEMISRNIQAETELIDDLLDVTRISRARLEIVREDLDLHDVLRRAIEVSQPDLHERRQHLSVSLEASQSKILGDHLRLQQVFWNLIKNASKFTPEGGQIRITSHNDAAGQISVEVTDSGRGINPDALQSIFDPFKQEDTAVSRQFGGLGLGLAIAKAAVLAHGGAIDAISSGRDLGSTFRVALPLRPDSPSGSANR